MVRLNTAYLVIEAFSIDHGGSSVAHRLKTLATRQCWQRPSYSTRICSKSKQNTAVFKRACTYVSGGVTLHFEFQRHLLGVQYCLSILISYILLVRRS